MFNYPANVTDDRQTDGRATANSERELTSELECEFTFAKNALMRTLRHEFVLCQDTPTMTSW